MTEPERRTMWTIDTYAAHNEALRVAQEKFEEERDRRYCEVNLEREKALKIKETADTAALNLQRDTQTYKDEKANELRSQIERERGSYATKDDLLALKSSFETQLRPITTYVASQTGHTGGILETRVLGFAIVASVVGVTGIILSIVAFFLAR